MINTVYLDGVKCLKYVRGGACFLDDGSCVQISKIQKIAVQCNKCKKLKNRKTYRHAFKTYFICSRCHTIGSKNPFYGKKHSQESKNKILNSIKGQRSGSKNSFYGKTHSLKTRQTISCKLKGRFTQNKNPFYGQKHSNTSKTKISSGLKKYFADPKNQDTIQQRLLNRKTPKFTMTTIERKVRAWLIHNNIKHKYSKRLGKYQFDFEILDKNILIEVQGDYWHANPLKYGEWPLKPLNQRQQFKIQQDAIKRKYAINNGYDILYIWEFDINNNNWESLKSLL